MRDLDWSGTDVGPPERWPHNLRMAVRVCLMSRFPMIVWWGEQRSFLYNDAYVPFLGESKHPRALGRPGRECWPEIWDTIGPMLDSVYATAVPTWSEDFLFFFERRVPREEVYVTFSYGPILSADGIVEGVFCPCTETTRQVLGARRLETLRRLSTRATAAPTTAAACREAAAGLEENLHDVPFAAIYLVDAGDERAMLQATSGVAPGAHPFPAAVSLGVAASTPWPLAAAFATRAPVVAEDLVTSGVSLPGGPWPEPSTGAAVVPLFATGGDEVSGLAVLGISPRLPFDDAYRTFFNLVAGHIGNAISAAVAHEAERQRAERLGELDRAKTTFFSNVSHEFRTPLTLMLGPLEELLQRGNGVLEVSREEIDLIHRNALRLQKHVNTLLDFARIESDRAQAHFASTELGSFTAELVGMFRSTIERAGLRLLVDCPPIRGAAFVDRGMYEKIVLNLVSNAFKFTLQGEIAVTLHELAGGVELCVLDTGSGIPPDELPHIFERFHRVEGAAGRTTEGSGIGLSLVRELVRMHGGEVGVDSTLGVGSRISVLLPLGRAHLPDEPVEEVDSAAALTGGARAFVSEAARWLDDGTVVSSAALATAPRVLVVDDNADLRRYVARILSDEYEVRTANDGAAGLKAALEEPPDLVVADVMMPHLDGIGLLRALRADPRTADIPVILLSARAGEDSQVEGLLTGADDYVVKPFAARDLRARVAARVGAARHHDAALAREQHRRATAEASESRIEAELRAELDAMTGLHELGTRLLGRSGLKPLLDEVLDATMALQGADFGTVQLFDEESRSLELRAQRGFADELLEPLQRVACQGTSGCALATGARCILEDVESDPRFPSLRDFAAAAGFRAAQSTPLFSRAGEPLGVLSTHFRRPHRPSQRDLRLTDRHALQVALLIEQRRTAEALRKREERSRRYFELGLIGMATTSPVKGILEVNDELCVILGYPREELLKKSWAELTHPDDLAPDVAHFERVLAGELEGYSLEKRWIRKDGTILHSIMSAKCARRPDGSVDSLVGLVQDISERKRAEDALKRTAAELADAQRIGRMGSWSWRTTTGAIECSDEVFRILGVERGSVSIGEAYWRRVHPDDVRSLTDVFRRASSQRVPFEVEHRIVNLAGEVRHVRVLGRLMPVGELAFTGVIMDVTERRRAEEAAASAQAELALASRHTAMGELAAAIAHELNQPLGAIVNYANICLRLFNGAHDHEMIDLVRAIAAAANRAGAVFQRIRALIRQEGREQVPIAIRELLSEVVTLSRRQLAEATIEVELRVPAELPPLEADRIQLQQLLLNLINNGIDAMRALSGKQRLLTIAARTDELEGIPALRIEVGDVGVGFSPELGARLFEPFHTTKRNGMGMGLRICRSIVEAHAGRIWATSTPGEGATFSCLIPFASSA